MTQTKTARTKGLARALGTRAACYAKVLGDCSGQIEKEHPISRSALTEGTIHMLASKRERDGKWTRLVETPPVKRKDASGPVLCAKHNRDLSSVDKYGTRFDRFLRQVSVASMPGGGHPGIGEFNGSQVARWFCKIALGSCALNGVGVPEALVGFTFGLEKGPKVRIFVGLRKEVHEGKVFVMNYVGRTVVRTFLEDKPISGAIAVARGPIEFIFSDRPPDDDMRTQLSPTASWEERPPQILWAPTKLDVRFDWTA